MAPAQPHATSRELRQVSLQLDSLWILSNPARHTRRPRNNLPRLPGMGRRRAEQHRPLPDMQVLHLGEAPNGHRAVSARQVGTPPTHSLSHSDI